MATFDKLFSRCHKPFSVHFHPLNVLSGTSDDKVLMPGIKIDVIKTEVLVILGLWEDFLSKYTYLFFVK